MTIQISWTFMKRTNISILTIWIIIMAKLKNLDILKETLKNQLKLLKYPPKMVLFSSIWVWYKLIWINIGPNIAFLRCLTFSPLQKPWFSIETLKNMLAPQIIELSSNFVLYYLVLFDSILWWAARSDGGHHSKWNRLTRGP